MSGPVSFKTCGFDTMLELFMGDCGNLTSLGCNDDSGGDCNLGSAGALTMFAGDVVHLRACGHAGDTGHGSLVVADGTSGPIGETVCEGEADSTGVAAVLRAFGSHAIARNDVTLRTRDLPPAAMAMVLASRAVGFTPNPGGSSGNLCLGAPTARFVSLAGPSTSTGEFTCSIDLTALPVPPTLAHSAGYGERWRFRCWHRDSTAAGATSNFSSAVLIEVP